MRQGTDSASNKGQCARGDSDVKELMVTATGVSDGWAGSGRLESMTLAMMMGTDHNSGV